MKSWSKNWRGFQGLLSYLWKYRVFSLLGLLGCLLADLAQLTVPMLTKTALDALAAGQSTTSMLLRQGGLILAIAVLAYGVRYGWRYFLMTAARLSEVDIRQRLFDRVARLPLFVHQQGRSGDVMSLATNDVMSIRMALAFGVMACFDAVAYSGMSIAAMLSLDWQLALWCLAPYPLLALWMIYLMDKNYRSWDQVQSAFDDLNEKARESVAGMRVLRAYVQEEEDARDFQQRTEQLYRRMMTYVRWDSLYNPAITFVSGVSSAILLGLGGRHVIDGTTTVGSFAAFSAYLGQLAWPMIAAGWFLAIVQRASASMSRIQDMLDHDQEFPDEAPEMFVARGELEARSLTFTYPQSPPKGESPHVSLAVPPGTPEPPPLPHPYEEAPATARRLPALQDLSFRLAAGGTLGIVGEVGSGKSTLASLLLRLFDPPPGSLFLDGRDVLDFDPRQLRQNIAWVPQEAFLFSHSIAENLRLGRDLPEQELRAASETAALHGEVMEFPQGYETLLGERGVTLSGGQKQRLALARSLVKPAPILIMDDTLSAVDASTERQILKSLKERIRHQTCIIISHRISSVIDADEILVLEAGHVVQRGSHSQLLAQEGLYQRMYEMQTEAVEMGVG